MIWRRCEADSNDVGEDGSGKRFSMRVSFAIDARARADLIGFGPLGDKNGIRIAAPRRSCRYLRIKNMMRITEARISQ